MILFWSDCWWNIELKLTITKGQYIQDSWIRWASGIMSLDSIDWCYIGQNRSLLYADFNAFSWCKVAMVTMEMENVNMFCKNMHHKNCHDVVEFLKERYSQSNLWWVQLQLLLHVAYFTELHALCRDWLLTRSSINGVTFIYELYTPCAISSNPIEWLSIMLAFWSSMLKWVPILLQFREQGKHLWDCATNTGIT